MPSTSRAAGAPAPYVFIGGVDVSGACLEALCQIGLPPALVVGYDESRAGASGFVDVAGIGESRGVDAVRTAQVNDPELVARIAALQPAIVYVIGWSQLIRPALLEVPANGCYGIHPTRLPFGRGRAPIPWTILHGLPSTASTMFRLTEGVDDGDIVGQIDIEVDEREDACTLYAKHRAAHVQLVTRHTSDLIAGRAELTPQDHSAATWWEARRPEDGQIDWHEPASDVDRLVRAVTRPFPGAFTESDGVRVTIWRAEPAAGFDAPPGTWRFTNGDAPLVACGEGALRVLEADGLDQARAVAINSSSSS